MRLKREPGDFRVEELAYFPIQGGAFAVYRLEKRSIGTLEALEAVARAWNLPRSRIAHGGMKDRGGATRQLVTIRDGPRRELRRPDFALDYLGQAARALEARDLAGNRFTVVLRGVRLEEAARIEEALPTVARDGVANYFDDQRFGSVGESGEFVGRAWCLADFERALWLALAEENRHDSSAERAERTILREHWKRWPECKAALPRGHRRSLVTYLADHPADFRGAFGRVRAELRGLYRSAFQSYLWNRLLTETLRDSLPPEALVAAPSEMGERLFFRGLDASRREALAELKLPMPSAKTLMEDAAMRARAERVAAEQGLTLAQIRIRYPRDDFFSKSSRPALFFAAELQCSSAPDEHERGKMALTLSFDLPRGSYATMLVKRLRLAARDPRRTE